MKVITLNEEDFIKKCRELRLEFEKKYGKPDLTIGIASGGEFVGRQFAGPFEKLAVVSRRRKSSDAKENLSGRIIKGLPRKANDLLRMGESKFYHLMWLAGGKKTLVPEMFEIPDHVRSQLRDVPDKGIIALVDDAADSGETLLTIRNAIQLLRPDLQIATAVLTVTRSQADPIADVALFRNETLIRFPWAIDY